MNLDFDKELKVCEAATPGPWVLWDGCSWRRFGCEALDLKWHGKTVILPTKCHHDGHPDLIVEKRDAEFVCRSRSVLPDALRRLKRLKELYISRYTKQGASAAWRKCVTADDLIALREAEESEIRGLLNIKET